MSLENEKATVDAEQEAIDAVFAAHFKDNDTPAAKPEDTAVEDDKAAVDAPVKEEAPAPEATEEAPAVEETATEPVAVPEGWQAEQWQALPKETQEVIAAREQERSKTFAEQQQFRQEYGWIRDIIEPQRQQLAIHGTTPQQAMQQLIAINEFATTKPLEYIQWYAQKMGVDLNTMVQEQQIADEYLTPEQREINQLKQQLNLVVQQQQQTGRQSIESEIAAFAAVPEHKYFDRPEVKKEMSRLLTGDTVMTMKDAYDRAIWAIPEIRTQLLAEQQAKPTTDPVAASKARVAKADKMTTATLPDDAVNARPGKTYEEQVADIFARAGFS